MLYIYVCVCVCVYTYIHIYVIYVYTYTYIWYNEQRKQSSENLGHDPQHRTLRKDASKLTAKRRPRQSSPQNTTPKITA